MFRKHTFRKSDTHLISLSCSNFFSSHSPWDRVRIDIKLGTACYILKASKFYAEKVYSLRRDIVYETHFFCQIREIKSTRKIFFLVFQN